MSRSALPDEHCPGPGYARPNLTFPSQAQQTGFRAKQLSSLFSTCCRNDTQLNDFGVRLRLLQLLKLNFGGRTVLGNLPLALHGVEHD
jgi:hypothetical protein